MFEEYLQDSYEFFIEGEREFNEQHQREAQRYFRAAVFYASGAMEAFVNYLAGSFAKAEKTPSRTLYLTDAAIGLSNTKGVTTEFHPLENKLRILILRFAPQFDFESLAWNHFVESRSSVIRLCIRRRQRTSACLKSTKSTSESGLRRPFR